MALGFLACPIQNLLPFGVNKPQLVFCVTEKKITACSLEVGVCLQYDQLHWIAEKIVCKLLWPADTCLDEAWTCFRMWTVTHWSAALTLRTLLIIAAVVTFFLSCERREGLICWIHCEQHLLCTKNRCVEIPPLNKVQSSYLAGVFQHGPFRDRNVLESTSCAWMLRAEWGEGSWCLTLVFLPSSKSAAVQKAVDNGDRLYNPV